MQMQTRKSSPPYLVHHGDVPQCIYLHLHDFLCRELVLGGGRGSRSVAQSVFGLGRGGECRVVVAPALVLVLSFFSICP
jgi:hypothetical protein